MKLYIDTSDSEKVVIKIDDEEFETAARQDKSQKLLPFIVEKLKEKNKTIYDVSSIEVNEGPGSFTGLRVGVSVANAMGYALKIRVNGKDVVKDGPVVPKYA